MDEKLIENWNSVVKPGDYVFHLGDFAFGGSQVWNSVLDRLNGNILLIKGNHDDHNIKQGYMMKFKWVGYQMRLLIENRTVYLNHYPFLCFSGAYRKGEQAPIMACGHVHLSPHSSGGLDYNRMKQMMFPTQYDVGVDNNNFTPVSWKQLKEIISKQQEEYEKSNSFTE